MVSERVGQYELKGVLGGGGMATVYRGEHVAGIGMQAAIKKLHPHLAIDQELRARLKVEAQALARLRHPNIVQIMDYVEMDEGCALVTELVEGQTLRSLLTGAEGSGLPLTLTLSLFRQSLEGMEHAHLHNCLHRDLKPGNLMVTAENQVKILDFGIANLIDTEAITQNGVTIGTPAYMAPEQLGGEVELDPRADLYSLGVILWEMLAGRSSRTSGERSWRLSGEDIDLLTGGQTPTGLLEILRRMVRDNREERYASCQEVLLALKDWAESAPLSDELQSILEGLGQGTSTTHGRIRTIGAETTEQGPITQTIIERSGIAFSGSTIGKVAAAALVLLAVASDLSQLLGDSAGEQPNPEELVPEDTKAMGTTDPSGAELAAPEVKADSSTLVLHLMSEPPGARLNFNGKPLASGVAEIEVPAVPGDHVLRAVRDGYETSSAICRIGPEAIAQGFLRCIVALQRTSSPPAMESAKRQTAKKQPKAKAESQKAKPEAKETKPPQKKPKIHKID